MYRDKFARNTLSFVRGLNDMGKDLKCGMRVTTLCHPCLSSQYYKLDGDIIKVKEEIIARRQGPSWDPKEIGRVHMYLVKFTSYDDKNIHMNPVLWLYSDMIRGNNESIIR